MASTSPRAVAAVAILVLTTACAGGATAIPGASDDGPGATETAAASGSAAASEGATGAVFTFPGGETPTVDRDLAGFPDQMFLNPGAVLVDDAGTFHMYPNAFTGWPGLVQIPHLTSTDGVAWTRSADATVLSSDDVPYAQPGADVSSAYVTGDGTWTLVFGTINFTRGWEIGRATGPGPDGPWTVDPEPILSGNEGEWDSGGVAWPSVVATDDGWAMYYSAGANPRTSTGAIGLATSTDGVTWTKHGAPVLEVTADWEGGALDRPRVQRTDEGWIMVYTGRTLTERGLAWSDDGVSWTPDPANPVLTADDFPINGKTWDTALLWHDGVLRYYMEIGLGAGSQTTDIYLGTHDGLPAHP